MTSFEARMETGGTQPTRHVPVAGMFPGYNNLKYAYPPLKLPTEESTSNAALGVVLLMPTLPEVDGSDANKPLPRGISTISVDERHCAVVPVCMMAEACT